MVKPTPMTSQNCYVGPAIMGFARVSHLYSHRNTLLFKQTHSRNGTGLYVDESEQTTTGQRYLYIMIFIYLYIMGIRFTTLILKVVSATFLLVHFLYLKDSTCETRKNVKSSFRS